MIRPSLIRATLAAALFTAMPFATATAISSTAAQAQHLANLKTRGTAEIDRRKDNLMDAWQKLQDATKIKAGDKDVLTIQINQELASLQALKEKLAADTDLATARTDVQSIVTDYRVYALMLPKARMVASADRFAVVEEKLTALHDKLLAKVPANTNPAAGIDAAHVKLADMEAKIAAAKTATDAIVPQLLALQPTDYNANHTVLVQHRASLKAAHDALVTARDDAKAVIDLLKASKAAD